MILAIYDDIRCCDEDECHYTGSDYLRCTAECEQLMPKLITIGNCENSNWPLSSVIWRFNILRRNKCDSGRIHFVTSDSVLCIHFFTFAIIVTRNQLSE